MKKPSPSARHTSTTTRSQNIGTVIVFRDFTREAEVERLKSTFVAIVSHELRTPLNAILGYAEMFKEAVYGPMNEKQVNMADRIMKNTQRLLGLINDLLDQAQMEAGKLTIHTDTLKPADLLEYLHGVMDKSASDKRLSLTSEIDPHLPDALMRRSRAPATNPGQPCNERHQIHRQGGVHVLLFRREKDNGELKYPIPEAASLKPQLPFIFDTFRQVEGADTRSMAGLGSGLSIVKQLVGLMNGKKSR